MGDINNGSSLFNKSSSFCNADSILFIFNKWGSSAVLLLSLILIICSLLWLRLIFFILLTECVSEFSFIFLFLKGVFFLPGIIPFCFVDTFITLFLGFGVLLLLVNVVLFDLLDLLLIILGLLKISFPTKFKLFVFDLFFFLSLFKKEKDLVLFPNVLVILVRFLFDFEFLLISVLASSATKNDFVHFILKGVLVFVNFPDVCDIKSFFFDLEWFGFGIFSLSFFNFSFICLLALIDHSVIFWIVSVVNFINEDWNLCLFSNFNILVSNFSFNNFINNSLFWSYFVDELSFFVLLLSLL